jgi:hypothetical protein
MRISALLAGLRIIKLGDCAGRVSAAIRSRTLVRPEEWDLWPKNVSPSLALLIHHVRCVDSRGGVNGRDEGLNAGGPTLRVGTCN